MLLVEFYFVGLILPFANSNYEYDYDPNSNYEYDYDPNSNYYPNVTIEDCNGPENDQLSKTNCFCYDAPETDIPYSICKESVLLSGMVMYFSIPQEPLEQRYLHTYTSQSSVGIITCN